MKNFKKFCDFVKILSKFSRKFMENLRKFWKYEFVLGVGGAETSKLAKLLSHIRKINGSLQTFENFHEL